MKRQPAHAPALTIESATPLLDEILAQANPVGKRKRKPRKRTKAQKVEQFGNPAGLNQVAVDPIKRDLDKFFERNAVAIQAELERTMAREFTFGREYYGQYRVINEDPTPRVVCWVCGDPNCTDPNPSVDP